MTKKQQASGSQDHVRSKQHHTILVVNTTPNEEESQTRPDKHWSMLSARGLGTQKRVCCNFRYQQHHQCPLHFFFRVADKTRAHKRRSCIGIFHGVSATVHANTAVRCPFGAPPRLHAQYSGGGVGDRTVPHNHINSPGRYCTASNATALLPKRSSPRHQPALRI